MFRNPSTGTTHRLRACLLACVVAGCGADLTSPDQADSDNQLGARPIDPSKAAAVIAKAKHLIRPGTIVQTEPRLGVPTFLWAARSAALTAASNAQLTAAPQPEIAAARSLLTTFAPLYGLSTTDIDDAVVANVDRRPTGPVLVKLRGQRDGVEIFGEELNILMSDKLEGIALSGYVTSAGTPAAKPDGLAFDMPAAHAAATMLGKQAGMAIGAAMLVPLGSRDGYDRFTVSDAAGITLDDAIRVKPVYFHLPEGLEAAYYVEVYAKTGAPPADVLAVDGQPLASTEAYAYVISAVTGQVMFRKDLVSHVARTQHAQESNLLPAGGFTYRVWADPTTGIPMDTPAGNAVHPHLPGSADGAQAAFVPPSDVTLPNFPFSQNDPWLAPGATETNGNNVDAFLNMMSPDGLGNPIVTTPTDGAGADYRAQITAAGQFLHEHIPDNNGALAEGRQGSIQQLFYNINFLHDWYYDAGFDEAAGNAQVNNYGRGGAGNDSIKAQVQDFQSFNNANMMTGADGVQPRMRMYNFVSPANHLELTATAAIAGKYQIGISQTGTRKFDVSANIVRATFTSGPTTCTVTNAAEVAGNIALFDFDNTDGTGCSFSTRIARISSANAAAALMVYTSGSPSTVANITGFNATHTKPVATISWNTGQLIKAELAVPSTVTARLYRAPDRDGSLDNQVVFHEWFHYATARLIGNGIGLGSNHAGGLGEGWSDFNAVLLTARENDRATAGNESFQGAYPIATYVNSGTPYTGAANHGYYFGGRRYPYSTDMAKNPLTFGHIVKNVALPAGPPVAFGANGANNEEVHNMGEVWATMLWECYAGLLRDTLGQNPRLTFQQAQDRMKQYLIAALKITPVNPTLTEARDALLAAAYANDAADYLVFRIAFAKRGAGTYAVSPDRFSSDNAGVVEDFAVGPDLDFVSAQLDDSLGSCDSDGVLDAGEYGRVSITLRNIGTTALTTTKATVSSTSSDVWFPNGATVSVPQLQPGASATVELRVAYVRTVAGIQQLPLQIEYTDDSLIGGPRSTGVGFRTNTDEIAAASATDDVESPNPPWTKGFAPSLGDVAPWQRSESNPSSHAWHVPDAGEPSDQYLVSPVFTVDGSGSFTVQFDHSYSFEYDSGGNYDGGVVEMAVNGGAWSDIGGPAYTGTLVNYTGNLNPLKTRPAFVKSSGGVIHTSLPQAIAPGSTVQIRFRAGTDNASGAAGWDIDNVAFSGVVETPFAVLVPENGGCAKVPASADVAITVDSGVTAVTAGSTVTYTIVASNNGPDDLIGATVGDAFPGGVTCTWTCTAAAGASCTATGSGNIADSITLPAGATATYTATCAIPTNALGMISNTASIATPGPVADPNLANNTATDTDNVERLPAHLIASKTVTGNFAEGGVVTYTIALTNNGQGPQFDNIGNELLDVLPAGLSLVNAFGTSGITYTDVSVNLVSWNGDLPAGGSVTITIIAVINAQAGTTISNQATFHYDATGDGTNNTSGTTDAYQCSMPL